MPPSPHSALREALMALDKQKAAFAESHGPFLYLAAIGTQVGWLCLGWAHHTASLPKLCWLPSSLGRVLVGICSGRPSRIAAAQAGPHCPLVSFPTPDPRPGLICPSHSPPCSTRTAARGWGPCCWTTCCGWRTASGASSTLRCARHRPPGIVAAARVHRVHCSAVVLGALCGCNRHGGRRLLAAISC